MKYLSMFAGVGGFEKGIEDATNYRQETPEIIGECSKGIHRELSDTSRECLQRTTPGNWECIGYSEIDKYASAIYRYHYPEARNYGDARAINPDGLPDIDLIVGGFPCQSFSIAGKRGGFEDTRGTLFFEIARIARAKRPGYLFLENVKGLLNHDEGNTFATIITTLDELGYDYQWQVLNSKYHGVPQNRERVFIIANLRDRRRPQIFPFRESSKTYSEDNEESVEAVVNCIDSNYHKGWLDHGQRTMVIHKTSGQSVTIKNDETGTLQACGGDKVPNVLIQLGLVGKKDNMAQRIYSPNQSKQNWDTYMIDNQIRRLTPIECERLQGFPEVTKSAILILWKNDYLDHQKNRAPFAEDKNLKLLRYVGDVERKDYNENALFVENFLSTNNPQIGRLVQPDVHILCGEKKVEIRSQGRLLLSVSTVENPNKYPLPIPIEDFVLLNVSINSILDQIVLNGEGGLHRNELCSILQNNGERLVDLSGKGIMLLAESAENDSTIRKKLLRFTTSNLLNTNILEQKLITSFSSAISAIDGFIPNEILQNNFLSIKFHVNHGWTKYGLFEDGVKEISDTQRYRCMGNAVTTKVIRDIVLKWNEN